jgi:gliding motility-associated-like protein
MKFFSFYIVLFFFASLLHAQDTTPPDTPKLDSVSVADPDSGYVYISWYPSDSADVKGYYIYRSINAVWQQIANVLAPATSYLDTSAAANFHPELYRIAAYDEANNVSPMTDAALYHNTIYVFPYQDSLNCHFAIRLNWNKYINWPEGVKEYQIYVSQNGGPWSLLTTVNNNTSQYYHMDVHDNTQYCYVIHAISESGKTSTSNRTCFYTTLPDLPQYINADYATVVGNSILLSFTLDNQATICRYQLLRSSDGIHFSNIASYNQSGTSNFIYTDNNVNVEQRYYYKLIALDQCNNDRLESNLATNIVLNAEGNDEIQTLLNWNSYYTWLGGIDSTYLYCVLDNGQTQLLYNQHAATDTSFLYDLTNIVLQNPGISGKFCYYVELVEGSGNPYSVTGRSKSNIACAYQQPRVFIPNSFVPNGDDSLDRVFKPSATFVDNTDYTFKVFDRWGGITFETNNPLTGWDGKSGGSYAPEGMYSYYVMYKSLQGDRRERFGRFFLFCP